MKALDHLSKLTSEENRIDLEESKEINKANIEANKIESQEKMKALDILADITKEEEKPKKGGKDA